MAASLPASAGTKPSGPPSPTSGGLLGQNAPAVWLPLGFVLVGLTALLTGVGWLVIRPTILAEYHYNQHVIAATHLFVLGWICSIVMGAMYQLVPVALETRLYSEKLARGHLVLHVIGFIGMVTMFSAWNLKQVGHFGSVLALGVGLFAFNLAATLRRVPRWNVTATAVTAALCWLTLTVTAGLLIALGKCSSDFEEGTGAAAGSAWLAGFRHLGSFMARFDPISAMHAHAHLGGVGLFTMLIVGVSYKLIPMFTLSEIQSRRRAGGSVALLNVGLAGAFVTILRRSPWKLAFAILVVVALIIYGIELRAILRQRKRRTLDWGLKYFLTAIGLYAPVALLGVVLAWPTLPLNAFTGQLENVYGFLGLLGAVSLAIMGMLYKIVPFLVWFGRYSRQIGRTPVPALADLYSSPLQVVGYWSYLSGLLVTSGAILGSYSTGVRVGCVLLALGVLTLAINVFLMLTHFFRPQSQPQPQLQPQPTVLVKPA